jgi:hypothetical protein
MSPSTPKLGVVEGTTGALASALKPHVELQPYHGSLAGLDGVVLDGQSATPGPLNDQQALKTILDSGKLLAVSNPSAQHLQSLRTLTGAGPQQPVALIAFTKVPGPGGRPAYRSVLVPFAQPPITKGMSEHGPVAVKQAAQSETGVAPLDPALVSALASPAARTRLGMPGSTALNAPPGATAGYSTFTFPVSWQIGAPSISGKADDSTAGNGTQTLNGSFTNEFYVYYVDGEKPTSPYYYVILRQTGTFSPLTPGSSDSLANNVNSRGWFQTEFQIHAAANNSQGQPFANGVSLQGHSPSPAADKADVGLQVTMTQIANTQDGTGPVQWTAEDGANIAFPDWAVDDLSSGINTGWRFHQSKVWDPTQNHFSDFGQWYEDVYSGNYDYVDQMPALSTSTLSYEALTAWRFDASLLTPPRSLMVHFSGSWGTGDKNSPLVAFLHNMSGCTGAEGSTHHHLFAVVGGWGWEWNIDLGQVAQPSSDERPS